jgi:hypothetical protein
MISMCGVNVWPHGLFFSQCVGGTANNVVPVFQRDVFFASRDAAGT